MRWHIGRLPTDYLFISWDYGEKATVLPPGRLFYGWLESDNSLIVHGGFEGLCDMPSARGGEEMLFLAGKNEAIPDKILIAVRVLRFDLFDGSGAIPVASPKCCTMIPA
jgi:hypothetical protein